MSLQTANRSLDTIQLRSSITNFNASLDAAKRVIPNLKVEKLELPTTINEATIREFNLIVSKSVADLQIAILEWRLTQPRQDGGFQAYVGITPEQLNYLRTQSASLQEQIDRLIRENNEKSKTEEKEFKEDPNNLNTGDFATDFQHGLTFIPRQLVKGGGDILNELEKTIFSSPLLLIGGGILLYMVLKK